MTKNGVVLSVVAVLLAAIYAAFFTNWFRKPAMLIVPTVRADRPSSIPRADDLEVYPVVFKLGREYRLTSIKVVVEEEYRADKYAPPLWHMVGDSRSIPTDVIVYGMKLQGMKPALPRAKPMPLDPKVSYLLLVEAGRQHGQTNFMTRLAPASRR